MQLGRGTVDHTERSGRDSRSSQWREREGVNRLFEHRKMEENEGKCTTRRV